ncbi:conserved hypothetical protein [Leishmania mexicana MHOM/GT/2001/U1103]|uniref:G domain-containing protein n=1 Tax=Leishmania mexicana (strain MHOM/GT/2001/U1103) TaxID=929439 RepID=E9B743_LEIMU|nr:conserved hypothetical protein [Leishmania mexicana MHOM/GT/2001/U1103]CBZ31066.1 conserved hypothetical protein [Leishmania mexicana MHOM/GT/2001/U1103]
MPIWPLSNTKHATVELNSDNEDVSSTRSSSSGSDHGGSGTDSSRSRSYPGYLSDGKPGSPRFPLPWFTPEEPPSRAQDTSLHINHFTAGATQRAIAAPAVCKLLMRPLSPAATVQATHQRVQSALERPLRREYGSGVNTPRALSVRSSRGGSFAFAPQVLEKYNTMNILVIGAPQVGKSLFINLYRAAITNTTRWPAAPVGISGFYGTTAVEPFPNHARQPTWLCIDTPGSLYTEKHAVLLEKLTQGMPWKTKLKGPNALTLSQIKDISPIAANKAHQCIIVVPATDLIEDEGWINTLLWRNRYRPADGVADIVFYLKGLISSLRAIMDDASPSVVVTKMDKVGGAGSSGACAALISILGQCVPVNRVYFTAAVENRALLATGRTIVLESSTKQNLVRLHEDICLAVQWHNQMDAM